MKWKGFVSFGKKAAIVAAACLPLLAACNNDDDTAPAATGVSFESVGAPSTDTEKRSVLVADTVTIDGKTYDISFNTILRSGQRPAGGGEVFGTLYDKNGNPIRLADGSTWISNANDFSSLLTGTDGKLYMVSHFEESPGGMYVTELSQNRSTGALSAVQTRHIDFSGFNGGWVHCAGSVTPWGTHLGSEEYEPDARNVDNVTGALKDYTNAQAYYFGLVPGDNTAGAYAVINPYYYGWEIEVRASTFDNVVATPRYAMGRVAHELAYVMPDRKTAYIADDGTNVGLFRFVADTAENLSAGTLYAAKWTQTSAAGGGRANLTWIDLGHATEAQVKAYVDNGTRFTDIFDTAVFDNVSCPSGYTITHVGHDIGASGKVECLAIKSGMELAASRLETRRYAAIKGGTTEFRKMEGITFNPDDNVLYIAMSEVNNAMLDNNAKADKGGPNDIRVPLNSCGAVYGLDVDSSYVATNMYGVVSGIPRLVSWGAAADNAYSSSGPFAKNKCDLDGIANPDNISYMPGKKTLLIGEDTGDGHQNDMVWAYNIETGALTRIQTTPYGSETTGVYFYPNINGWGYIMSVIQHPYGESDQDKTVPGSEETKAYTGYIGPFPAMN